VINISSGVKARNTRLNSEIGGKNSVISPNSPPSAENLYPVSGQGFGKRSIDIRGVKAQEISFE
jgi:hypothetical protein